MQYQPNPTCCGPNPYQNGWCYSGCGQTMPIVPGSNPALNYWNGQNFIVADGSSQNPISLPNLQTNATTPSYVLGVNNTGQWFYYPYSVPTSVGNLSGGQAGDVPWQSAPSVTSFVSAGTYGEILTSGGSGSPFWTPTADFSVGNITGGFAGEVVYQVASSTTGFVPMGTTSQILSSNGSSAPSWLNQSAITAGNFSGSLSGDVTGNQTSTNVALVGGQTASAIANATVKVGNASSSDVVNTLVQRDSAGNFSATTITANLTGNASSATNATTSTNLSGGSIGQIAYQNAPSSTSFLPSGTAGQLLNSNGSSAPSWLSTSAISVNSANNIVGGSAGSVPYQISTGTTGFTDVGSAGQILESNGTSAPTWVNQSSISAGSSTLATTATNLAGGATGSLPYQTSSGQTAELPASSQTTAPQILMSWSGVNGNLPYWANGNGSNPITVQKALYLSGGSAGSVPYQVTAGQTAFSTIGTSGQVFTSTGTTAPTWTTATNLNTASAIVQRDASGNFTAGTITASLSGNASTSTNIVGGSAGSVPYQTASATTTTLPIGTSAQILTVNSGATAPQWQTGITGVTNGGNATAGLVGEWVASNIAPASAVTLTTTGTVYGITSITLSAGDWDVSASVNIHLSSTSLTTARGGISTSNNALTIPSTSTTGVASNSYDTFASLISTSNSSSQSTTLGIAGDLLLATKTSRVNLSGTVTLYLVATASFTGTAPSSYGTIEARRVR